MTFAPTGTQARIIDINLGSAHDYEPTCGRRSKKHGNVACSNGHVLRVWQWRCERTRHDDGMCEARGADGNAIRWWA